jgi:hypothetical protein
VTVKRTPQLGPIALCSTDLFLENTRAAEFVIREA